VPGGYWSKILWVNLTDGTSKVEELPEETLRSYIGGSGLGARLLYDLTGPETAPLGPDNPLIFATGPFCGTMVPTAGRHHIIARSPLTGIWGESDVGGSWGTQFKRCGYDALVVTGRAARPTYLWITNDGVELRDASHVWGRDTYEVDETLRRETDAEATVMTIGVAGENQVHLAAILTDGKDGRAAGRCGLGAVMGSKRLKAVVALGRQSIPVADSVALREAVRPVAKQVAEATASFGQLGTAGGLIGMEQLGDLPIKNWYQGSFEEGAERISGQRMRDTILTERYGCAGCIIRCGRTVRVEGSPYGPVEGAGPEYETLAMFGSMLLIDDLEAVAAANELCNRLGVDTISTGAVISFAMEAFEKGLLTKEDTGGLELAWGEPAGALAMVKLIAHQEGIGKLLGRGVRYAAAEIGGLANEMAIHCKGLEFPAHDPRAHNSQGLSYATSNRGACHVASFSHSFEKTLSMPDLGYPEPLDRFGWEERGRFTAVLQDLMGLMDSLKLCKFILFGGVKVHHMVEWLNCVTGWDMDLEEFMRAGERIFNLKRMFNVRCGISRKDDVLPPRITTHRRGEGGAAHNLPPINEMLAQYYEHRGWDEMGIPTSGRLQELGL